MKTTRMITAAALVLSALIAAPQSLAQPGFYIGGSLGSTNFDSDIATGLITAGSVDGSSSGFKIFGGYQFNDYFGLDLALVDLGKAQYGGSFFGTPVTGGTVEVFGVNFSAVGTWPVTPAFAFFGKIGLFAWEAEARDTTGGIPFSGTEDGADLSIGLGFSVNFTRNLSGRVEWERFGMDSKDLGYADLLSLGLVYRF
jgi:OOP family OmpA-OmpF porin